MPRIANSTRMMVWGVGTAVVISGSALAGPPNADEVSAKARVLVHLDLDALNHSKIGSMLLDRVEEQSNNFEELRQVFPDFTLRPGGGLHGVTAYAGGVNDNGPEHLVVLVHGDEHLKAWDDDLVQMMAENGGETVDIDGHHTLAVPMDKDTGYLTLVHSGDDYTWVFGQDVAALSEGLGVLAGEKEAVQGTSRERIEDMWRDGTIAMVGTARLKVFENMEKASAVLNLANEVWARVGETDGEFFAGAKIHSNEQKRVNQLASVFQGAVTFGSIMAQNNEKLAEVMPMVNAFKIYGKDGYLSLGFQYDAQGLIDFIKEHADENGGWHADINTDEQADHDAHDNGLSGDDGGWGDDDD